MALFVTNFVVGRMVPTLAAFFVLRAILDTASGEHPLPSIIAAMFLLGTQTTFRIPQAVQHVGCRELSLGVVALDQVTCAPSLTCYILSI